MGWISCGPLIRKCITLWTMVYACASPFRYTHLFPLLQANVPMSEIHCISLHTWGCKHSNQATLFFSVGITIKLILFNTLGIATGKWWLRPSNYSDAACSQLLLQRKRLAVQHGDVGAILRLCRECLRRRPRLFMRCKWAQEWELALFSWIVEATCN